MIFSMHELGQVDQTGAVAGSEEGAATLSRLIARTAAVQPRETETLFLDFRDVDVATASWLRQAVLGFRDYCRRTRPDLYPVVANANEFVLEELGMLLGSDAVVCCDLPARGEPRNPRLVGVLEDKQAETLRAVSEIREVDAATLTKMHEHGAKKIGHTGWNNRLAGLASKGILMEVRRGRAKFYRPLFEEMSHGS